MKVGKTTNLDQTWSMTINITQLIFLCWSPAKPEGNSKVEAMDERVIWQGQLSSISPLTFRVNSPDLAGWLRVISTRPHYPMGISFETPWMIIKRKGEKSPSFIRNGYSFFQQMFIGFLLYIQHCLVCAGEQDRLDSYAQSKDSENKKEAKLAKVVNGNTCNEEKYGDIR